MEICLPILSYEESLKVSKAIDWSKEKFIITVIVIAVIIFFMFIILNIIKCLKYTVI